MNDQILTTILKSSYTLHDVRKRVRILKAYVGRKLFGADTGEVDLEIRSDINWLSQLGDDFYRQFNQNNYSQIFTDIENKITQLTPLVIYFAFESNQTDLQNVGSWLRKNYGPEFIFDAKYDPGLIAGCAFVWKGVYRDYSLRSKIQDQRQAIIEVIRGSVYTTK